MNPGKKYHSNITLAEDNGKITGSNGSKQSRQEKNDHRSRSVIVFWISDHLFTINP